jgi:hypothetical protein
MKNHLQAKNYGQLPVKVSDVFAQNFHLYLSRATSTAVSSNMGERICFQQKNFYFALE